MFGRVLRCRNDDEERGEKNVDVMGKKEVTRWCGLVLFVTRPREKEAAEDKKMGM